MELLRLLKIQNFPPLRATQEYQLQKLYNALHSPKSITPPRLPRTLQIELSAALYALVVGLYFERV